MKLAHSLLGSAAALCAAMAGAKAADLPVQKAAPVEYVRVCTTAGEGFFYIPGTDTCLRIGGRVRAERITVETFDRRDDAIGFLARGRLNVDARTETEYGTLRAFFRYEITRSTGAYFDAGSAINGVGDPGQARAVTNLDRAFVQFGGLTAGRTQSFFDFYANDLAFSAQLGSDLATQVLAYTYTVGDFTATISMEDGIERRVFNSPSDFRGTGVLFPGFATPGGRLFPDGIAVGGETAPDGVVALGVTKEWGSAQLSGAVHQVRSANLTQNIRGAAGFRPDVADTEYGYAVQGGVKINLPFLAAGDVLWLQAAYADGAINYLGFGTDTSVRNRGPFILNQSDAFVNVRGDLKTTEGFSVVGAFSHYFTPQIRGELLGSYGRLDYNREATGVVAADSGFGRDNPRLVGGSFGFIDTQEYRLEASAIYSPVKDLDIGVDVLYQNIDPKGRVIGAKSGFGGSAPRLYDDQDVFIGRMRVQRDF